MTNLEVLDRAFKVQEPVKSCEVSTAEVIAEVEF